MSAYQDWPPAAPEGGRTWIAKLSTSPHSLIPITSSSNIFSSNFLSIKSFNTISLDRSIEKIRLSTIEQKICWIDLFHPLIRRRDDMHPRVILFVVLKERLKIRLQFNLLLNDLR